MVDYNSLKTEEDRKFVILHGAENCYFKKLRSTDAILEIMQIIPFLYEDEDGFTDTLCEDAENKYGGKGVLVARIQYCGQQAFDNFICGDDNVSFLDEMFVDSKF